MNTRIIDLIKNPEAIQLQDLDLLKKEININPYIQNIRALHLYGIHQLQPENYQKELSVTAAYTTDKKILYQFINKKIEAVAAEDQNEEIQKEIIPETKIQNHIRVDETESELPKPVIIDGVLNRILFEGEEDFWESEHEVIDLESTLESGTLTLQKVPNRISEEIIGKEVLQSQVQNSLEKSDETESNKITQTAEFSSEVIIKEENIAEEKKVILNPAETSFHEIPEFEPEENQSEAQKEIGVKDETSEEKTGLEEEKDLDKEIPAEPIEDSSQISFHATQEFLPEVKIEPSKTEIKKAPPTVVKISKHEEEMQRLIAEVEAKMKSAKKEKAPKPTQESTANADINFSETQTFELEKVLEEVEVEVKSETAEKSSFLTSQLEERTFRRGLSKRESVENEETTWKPMNFSGEIQTKAVESVKENSEPIHIEDSSAEDKEERPAINVSFFAPDVSANPSNSESVPKTNESINEEVEKIEDKAEEKISPEIAEVEQDSNFPKFLNTWQNWLKIDRKEEKTEIITEQVVPTKENVIEKFIQKEPRISKLKEDSEFVAKERDGNISHLMTETLAQLYTNQKLFSKAIKAYQLLADKHPAKKEYFQNKILEVKELRKNP